MQRPETKCIFFDRDGIVNESPGSGYVERWEDFKLLTEFVRVLRLVREAGYQAVVVSNQRCVSLGKVSRETVDDMHDRLWRVLREEYGLELLDILYCPHGAADACECRKPRPGMLLEASRRHGIDLTSSWMIGDQERDIEAGRRAGCRTILVSAEHWASKADFQVFDLKGLFDLLNKIIGTGREDR